MCTLYHKCSFANTMLCRTGTAVRVAFPTPLTEKQWAWLSSTNVPLQSITFCSEESASHAAMEPVSTVFWPTDYYGVQMQGISALWQHLLSGLQEINPDFRVPP